MKSKRKRAFVVQLLYGAIAGLLIGISAIVLFLVQDRLRERDLTSSAHFKVEGAASFDGAIHIAPAIDAPAFELTDAQGKPRRLRDLRGRFVLLTFGFTNCPDICPLTLTDLAAVKDMLGARSDQVSVVFISVDGSRDTPAVLRRYFEFRGLSDIVGLTGAEYDVRAFGAPFGLSFEVVGDPSAGSYSINHTAGSFLLDRQGRWIMRFQFGVPPETIAAELLDLLS